MQHKTLGILCSVGIFSLISGTAQAQNTAGALQLALGTDVVSYTNQSSTVRFPTPAGDVVTDSGTTRWGFSDRSTINLEIGYGLGDSLVLGGFLGLGGWSQKDEFDRGNPIDQTNSTFNLLIAPKLDYMFLPGQAIRPFIGGALGITHQTATTEVRQLTNARTTTDDHSATGLAIMPRVGVRFFLTPGFSIDPAFTFLWIPTASGSYRGVNALKYDLSAHSYTVGLTVAASGWVGL